MIRRARNLQDGVRGSYRRRTVSTKGERGGGENMHLQILLTTMSHTCFLEEDDASIFKGV